jgi:DNA-binding MarR family transcriptional regulator
MVNVYLQKEIKEIGEIDQVVHTPARLMTVMLLSQHSSLDFIQLMNYTALTWGNLSTHLSKLEEAGYVMITKTFKGRRPNTLISLTNTGRQAYMQWGNSIIKALPQSVAQNLIIGFQERNQELEQDSAYAQIRELPLTPTSDVFFLPRYHKWGMELPPIKEYSPLS